MHLEVKPLESKLQLATENISLKNSQFHALSYLIKIANIAQKLKEKNFHFQNAIQQQFHKLLHAHLGNYVQLGISDSTSYFNQMACHGIQSSHLHSTAYLKYHHSSSHYESNSRCLT
jgi:hypothetical protein